MTCFKNDRYRLFLFCLILLPVTLHGAVLSAGSPETSQKKILILTEQLYPLNYTAGGADNEQVLGYATELVRAVMDESGLPYEIRLVPWARLVRTLAKTENTMAFSMSRTKTRDPLYHWIGEIIPVRLSLFGKRSEIKNLPSTLEEAKKYRIGTHNASVVNQYLKSKGFPNLIEVKSNNRYMELLERNRFDLFPFIEYAIGPAAIRKDFDPDYFARIIPLPDLSQRLWIAMSKNSDPELLAKLKAAYKNTKQSGLYQSIMESVLNIEQSSSLKMK
ncbi:MAG: polar amino acid transport system substrate-binding protein [Candidatus Azotimanducaceae bacterium]|jgi:polar amino acid transport system substrate-binding protein